MELQPSNNDVRVIDVFKVAPAPDTSPATSFSDVPLTFFDAIWLRSPPTQRVFFYQIHDLSLSLFSDAILPNLKHSLSLTLQHYPHLAGNLTWHPDTGVPVFRYTSDDGVFLTVAESTAEFHSFSTDNVKAAEPLHALLPDFHISKNQATVMSIQVTLFPGYGFSIGYNVHHAALDGKTAALFFKSWAKICQVGVLPPELTPVLERSLIDDPLDICKIYTDYLKKVPPESSFIPMEMKAQPPNLFRGTFRLTRKHISDIKAKINMTPVSTFTAVCSFIWTCLVKAERDNITNDYENAFLVIIVECRLRLEPPIPANYVGNCVTYRIAEAKVECLEGGDGLVTATTAIKEAIGSLPKGVVKGAEKWYSDENVKVFQGKNMYSIGGSPLFGLYGSDFGWGRPAKVEMVSNDKNGAFSLCDDRDDNGGMEVGIVLTKPKIEAFKSIFARGLEEIDNGLLSF